MVRDGGLLNETVGLKFALMVRRDWVLLALLFLSLSACASQHFGEAPAVDPQIAAEIVVIHKDTNNGNRTLTLDGQAIAALPHDSFTRFAVQPGPHWLGVGCAGALQLSWTGKNHTFIADPRMKYYFLIAPAPRCATIEPLSEPQAQHLMSGQTYRPMAVARPTS